MTRDLYEKVMGQVLAAAGVTHFSARELCRVGREAVHGGKAFHLQAPPASLFRNIVETARVAQWLREQVGPIDVRSGYRDAEYNAAIGGESHSLHLEFNALDLAPREVSAAELARLAARHAFARHMGVGLYVRDGFVHVDTRGFLGRVAPARWPQASWQPLPAAA